MSYKPMISILGMVLMASLQNSLGQGTQLEVLLKDGQHFNGELLSVRDSALLLSTSEFKRDDPTSTPVKTYFLVSVPRIQRIIERGNNNIGNIMAGFLVGGVTGYFLGGAASSLGPYHKGEGSLPGSIIGAAAGVTIGAIVGSSSGEKDRTIDHPTRDDISALKPLSHFPNNEPDYLKELK